MDIITQLLILTQQLIVDAGFLGLVLAMILQSVISPIPSELVLALAGASYTQHFGLITGIFYAFVFAFIGSILGALFCHQIGFYLERFVEKRVTKSEMELFTIWLEKYGLLAIIVTRLIPFIPFDAISYVAGIVKMDRKIFIIGSSIGLIPRILFYLFLGAGIAPIIEKDFFLGLSLIVLIIVILLLLLFIAKKLFFKQLASKSEQHDEMSKQDS